jgi:MoxR-like ATPase
VGKTALALSVCQSMGRPHFRVDGDARFTEQKLTGWFDPPTVLKKGYTAEAFVEGPLLKAMKLGGVLFINELNRLPEGVQNVLLPALDEKILQIPKLGELKARAGFQVIATQNPREFVATSHLSEAILDRFELLRVDYQSEEEEASIVLGYVGSREVAQDAVKIVRATRSNPKFRRGASVRAAISMAELAQYWMKSGRSRQESLYLASLLSLPTRVEMERGDLTPREQFQDALLEIFRNLFQFEVRKQETLEKKSP